MTCKMRRRAQRSAGFTIIELATVLVVVGILTAIGLVNFMRFRHRASYSSCAANQRHAVEAALLYSSTTSPGTVTIDVDVLTVANYLSQEVAECPLSTVADFNDYSLDFVDNQVTAIRCKVEPIKHAWNVP
jgi:prepilin-type N-terminal cleavage/methylation domain-containing protein